MDYERGQPLKAFVQSNPLPSEAALKAIVRPLLDGLEKVHASGFLHRDIKPDNIFLREDGCPVLIDFGSARQTASDSGQPLTTILTPGYAPFEQYTTSKKQGPWSDIYSLGGVLYFLVTGKNPPDAITRMKGDTVAEQLAPALDRYSPTLIEAIEWALALEETARPGDVATWRNALLSPLGPDRNATPSSVGVRAARVEPYVPTDVLEFNAIGSTTAKGAAAQPTTTVQLQPATEEMRTQVDPPLRHARGWDWMYGYLLLIVVCFALAASIAKLPAFQEAHLIQGKLNAAMVAQLLGTTGLIVFIWMLGRGLVLRFRAEGGPRAVLCDLLTPIVTLIAMAIAYVLLQRPLAPLFDKQLSSLYARGFLLGTCACAVWLSMAVFTHAEPLRKLLHEYRSGGTSWARSKEK
jgi:hypothetical protein